MGDDEASGSGLVGSIARLASSGVAQEVSLLRPVVRAVGFVDEEVDAPGMLDDGLAGTGVGSIDHGRTSLSDVEAHALKAVIYREGGDLRVADPGACPWDELAPEEAFPEPILHARDLASQARRGR